LNTGLPYGKKTTVKAAFSLLLSVFMAENRCNMPFMKDVISCLEQLPDTGTHVHYGMTTNATLLDRYMDFFKNNVFMYPEDPANAGLNKREIFMHQILNTSNFGKLTVMPDSTVYANVNMPPLGTVKDTTIHSLIYKEFTEGKSGFCVRDAYLCKAYGMARRVLPSSFSIMRNTPN
jgi:hypothetical protein